MEILARTYYFLYRDIPFFGSIGYFPNPELGWEGKKIFRDPSTKKFKIFFIGDSFTGGAGIKEKYMYYNVIKNNLDIETFVYGGGAYGTLQEYIALNKYLDYIKPNLVVLQVCDNDFINNSWELESRSFIYNDFMVRPYLIDERIEYRFPRAAAKLILFLSNSRFFYTLINRTDRFFKIAARKGLLRSVENDIQEKELNFANFKNAVGITDRIIAKIKSRTSGTPLIAFPVDTNQPYFEQFRMIFKKNNIEFIEGVAKTIRQQESRGVNLRLKNGHFNEVGNQICGQVLAEALKQFIKSSP